ncbi:hypothetical protein MUK42_30702 [Musa troglodytarum]|uniref:RING-type domain-containing protein n=1 Tax=Musa troglodytarum TaxID=320322 RepID=A0A9E7FRV0_9LILI|nr:hypothetical protein MUK42_30702 [Musa troglodytarum]
MATQAQRRCRFLLPSSQGKGKEMDFPQAAPGVVDSAPASFADGAAPHPRKRGRDAIGVPVAAAPQQQSHPANLFSLQPEPCSGALPPPTLVSLAQLRSRPPPIVSTGLHLSFEEQHQQQNQKQSDPLPSSSSCSILPSSLLPEEIAPYINQQKDEIGKLLYAQGEQLRQAFAEKWRRHCRSLLGVAKEWAAAWLREKEADVELAMRRSAELEDSLSRLRTESMAWQAKAIANQATAAALHARLQQAAAAPTPAKGRESAEDAESAFVDAGRVEPERAACRVCRGRPASVVLLPCRHLCLCDACDDDSGGGGGGGGGAAESCPVCRCVTTASVRVLLA